MGTSDTLPAGHAEQESASLNGFTSGDDMYLLIGQHPCLAVLMVLPLPSAINAFLSPSRESHLLPHKVRLNPLSLNTADHKNKIGKIKRTEKKHIYSHVCTSTYMYAKREKKKNNISVYR